jgi:hypothetical protein
MAVRVPRAALEQGWQHPERETQLDLFKEPRDRLLALAGISLDDAEGWRARGWVSFDVRDVAQLDNGRIYELCFVRDLARSGLSKVQIDVLLEELDAPYLYDPARTAYSFNWGWVQLPPQPTPSQMDEYVRRHLSEWILGRAAHGEHELLRAVREEILKAMVRFQRVTDMTGSDGTA